MRKVSESMNINLEHNTVISNKELTNIFKCSPQGGMRKANRTNTLTLISDKTKLYDDKLVGDIYYYTGKGQEGDQTLTRENLTLAQSPTNGIEVHFFEVLKPKKYTYKGQVELAESPFQEMQPDKHGLMRKVWIFPLRLKSSNVSFSSAQNQLPIVQQVQDEFNELEQLKKLITEVTEQERLIKTRVGQGKFKRLLLQRGSKCALCKVTDERLLIASHIKSWSESSNEERLDPNNGLLLCPNHDALFDKYLISFKQDGDILISDSLNEVNQIYLNVNHEMKLTLSEERAPYILHHRKKLKD